MAGKAQTAWTALNAVGIGQQIINGSKMIKPMWNALAQGSGSAAAQQADQLLSASMAVGRSMAWRGAGYGAAGGAVMGMINNIGAGGSPFDGLPGNALRGAAYGAIGGFAGGTLHRMGGGSIAGAASRTRVRGRMRR